MSQILARHTFTTSRWCAAGDGFGRVPPPYEPEFRQIIPPQANYPGNDTDNILPYPTIWCPDLKVPETKEEYERAAAKYGMIVEDYEPIGNERVVEGQAIHFGD